MNLVKDILLALNNRGDITPQIPPTEPVDRYFKKTILLEQSAKDYAQWINGEWKKSRINFSETDCQIFFEQYRKKYVPNLYMVSLDEYAVKKLLKKSKSNELTVNEIIYRNFCQSELQAVK